MTSACAYAHLFWLTIKKCKEFICTSKLAANDFSIKNDLLCCLPRPSQFFVEPSHVVILFQKVMNELSEDVASWYFLLIIGIIELSEVILILRTLHTHYTLFKYLGARVRISKICLDYILSI